MREEKRWFCDASTSMQRIHINCLTQRTNEKKSHCTNRKINEWQAKKSLNELSFTLFFLSLSLCIVALIYEKARWRGRSCYALHNIRHAGIITCQWTTNHTHNYRPKKSSICDCCLFGLQFNLLEMLMEMHNATKLYNSMIAILC